MNQYRSHKTSPRSVSSQWPEGWERSRKYFFVNEMDSMSGSGPRDWNYINYIRKLIIDDLTREQKENKGEPEGWESSLQPEDAFICSC